MDAGKDEWDIVAEESVVKRESPTKNTVIHLDLIVSQFCHAYPGEFQNGDIPFRLFWMLWSHFHRIVMLHKTIHAESYMIGKSVSIGSDKAKKHFEHMTEYTFGHRENI